MHLGHIREGLASLRPALYGNFDNAALASALRGAGVKVRNVHVTGEGTQKGVRREALEVSTTAVIGDEDYPPALRLAHLRVRHKQQGDLGANERWIEMFVETITAPREEWQDWVDRVRLFSEPPAALVATVVWDIGDGKITHLNVWDDASAVGDFYVERIHAVVEASGPPANKPVRHGSPVASYFRSQAP